MTQRYCCRFGANTRIRSLTIRFNSSYIKFSNAAELDVVCNGGI
uniref:Uncharacterized protein n=1 Tax=Anguilla anguilla TaxID=7936 RepID=A0A0E9XK98_ANGAN